MTSVGTKPSNNPSRPSWVVRAATTARHPGRGGDTREQRVDQTRTVVPGHLTGCRHCAGRGGGVPGFLSLLADRRHGDLRCRKRPSRAAQVPVLSRSRRHAPDPVTRAGTPALSVADPQLLCGSRASMQAHRRRCRTGPTRNSDNLLTQPCVAWKHRAWRTVIGASVGPSKPSADGPGGWRRRGRWPGVSAG